MPDYEFMENHPYLKKWRKENLSNYIGIVFNLTMNQQGDDQVWRFQLRRLDENPARPNEVSVELRGNRIDGIIRERSSANFRETEERNTLIIREMFNIVTYCMIRKL
jgi:hypothetical protein